MVLCDHMCGQVVSASQSARPWHVLTHLHLPAPLPTANPRRFSLASEMLAEPSIFESYVYGAQWMMKPFK